MQKLRWIFSAIVKTSVGVTTSQRQTDQKPKELPRMQPEKFKKASALVVQSRLTEKWWREAMECF